MPRPPARETAAARAPPPANAIGAETIGWRSLNALVNRVESVGIGDSVPFEAFNRVSHLFRKQWSWKAERHRRHYRVVSSVGDNLE